MAYLFLSYTKSDKDSAFTIRTVLQRAGFQVWMDENPYELSEKHWYIIAETIRNADGFVLLVSDDVKKSSWVKRELDFAEDIQKPIFPILVQGEGWSRLKMDVAQLGLGLKLDMPADFIVRIQNATQSQIPAPPQIPSKTIDKPKEKKPFPIRKAMWTAIFVLIALMLLPFFRNWMDMYMQNEAMERYFDATRTQSLQIQMTRTQARMEMTQGRETAASRDRATQHAVQNIRATQSVLDAAATNRHEASLNITAIAGNGVLPCEAEILRKEGMIQYNYYGSPSVNAPLWVRHRAANDAQTLSVTEWIVNEEGIWYRANMSYVEGYFRAEDLLLAENCPR